MKCVIFILLIIAGTDKTFSQVIVSPSTLLPVAGPTIFLDFDGEVVNASPWNWEGEIHASPCTAPPLIIEEILTRVRIDFSIFNLAITTDSLTYFAAPSDKRLRIIVTPTNEWYGQSGGASFIGSFTWGDDTPAWVFSTVLSNNPKYIAEAISHEIGHSMGLQHHSAYDENCNKIYEYHPGNGDDLIGWAPIMGEGYTRNMTTWSMAPNPENCNVIQDDLAVLSGILDFLPDDHSDQATASTPLNFSGISQEGLINSASDVDWFKFTLNQNSSVSLKCTPQSVDSPGIGSNLHIGMAIYKDNKLFYLVQNPEDPSCALDTTLPAGQYFISIEGTGNKNMNDYSSLGRYTLTGSAGAALPVNQIDLRGRSNGNEHLLNWTIDADEKILSVVVEHSVNGKDFLTLATLPPNKKVYHWRPSDYRKYYYRLRVMTESGMEYYSNIITVYQDPKQRPRVIHNVAQSYISLYYEYNSNFAVFGSSGQLLISGRAHKGLTNINLPPQLKGLLVLTLSTSAGSFNYKLIKN